MHIQISEKLLAWSKDGQTALVEHAGAGPEGGHGYALRLVSAVRGVNQRYLVTSTYSPGDGSEPERISPSVCRSRLTRLQADLKTAGFAGVQVDVKACDQGSDARMGAVHLAEPVDQDRPEKYPPEFIYRDWVMVPTKGGLQLTVTGQKPFLWTLPELENGNLTDARLSPDRHWILLFWAPKWVNAFDEQMLMGQSLYSKTGLPKDFLPLVLPEMRETP